MVNTALPAAYYGGNSIQNYAAGGYVTTAVIPYEKYLNYYNDEYVTITNDYFVKNIEGGKSTRMEIIDALFLLKPELAEAYKTKDGDGKREFYKDLLAAAEAKKNTDAAEKLSGLLGLEAK